MQNSNHLLKNKTFCQRIDDIEALSAFVCFFEQTKRAQKESCLLVAPLVEIKKIKTFLAWKNPDFDWSELPSFPIKTHLFSQSQHLQRRAWQAKIQHSPGLFLASPEAILKKTSLKAPVFCLKPGDYIPDLEALFYKSKAGIQKPGDFSLRGFILDIYSPAHSFACRLEIQNQQVESIHQLSNDFKRRKEQLHQILIPSLVEWMLLGEERKALCDLIKKSDWKSDSLREDLLKKISRGGQMTEAEAFLNALDPHSSLDLLKEKSPLFLCWPRKTRQCFEQSLLKVQDSHKLFTEKNLFIPFEALEQRAHFIVPDSTQAFKTSSDKGLSVPSVLFKKTENLKQALENLPVSHLIFIFRKKASKEAISKVLLSEKSFIEEEETQLSLQSPSFFKNKTCIFLEGSIGESFFQPKDTAYLQVESLLSSKKSKDTSSTFEFFSRKAKALDFSELEKGDLVIHVQHGLAQFHGLETLILGEQSQDFFTLLYQGKAKLLVPAYKAKDIKKYTQRVGQKISDKFLDKLGDSKRWNNKKNKAKQHIQTLVIDLMNHYRKRQASYREPFKKCEDSIKRFQKEFPFQETSCQTKVIAEILSDMDKPQPLDRLICADVGFGKTEVSLRAVLRALENNKQVCFLAPTTVLSLQHYENLKKRFQQWPYRLELLNRFVAPKKRKEILEQLKNGQVDLLICTHGVFSTEVSFKNLGLLIIDEEHRFGVRQKEKLLKRYPLLDRLSLSATPIPRTLNMALSGMKDISVLSQAPAKRKPIKTFIKSWEESLESLIVEACQFEKNRGGQVLFIHNRVKSIETRMKQLQFLLPKFKIALIHGGLASHVIEKNILEFFQKKYDLLISTNIVESGMDIPEANTIFIDKVQDMGLNQIYQLRGRVGRRHIQAYCYLLIPSHNQLTAIASERLSLLEKHSDWGSGFRLAMHDLQMRGAGSLFGAEQSGHLHDLGDELFFEILNENLEQEKTGFVDPEIFIPLSFGIPSFYIPDAKMRLLYYKTLSEANKEDQLEEIKEDMLDHFGDFPEDVNNLFSVLKLKFLCKQKWIHELKALKTSVTLSFHNKALFSTSSIIDLIKNQQAVMKNEYTLKVPLKEEEDLFLQIEKIIDQIQ